MVPQDYNPCIDRILAHEGEEYTDGVHPYDPGGPTKWGCTITDVRQFLNPRATAADVRRLTKDQAKMIFRQHYAVPLRFDDLPAGLDYTIDDYGINSGISRAGKVLRRALGMSDSDWHITDQVLAEVKKRDANKLIDIINDERMRFLQSLSIWPTYRTGWTIRVREVRAFSHQLNRSEVSIPAPTTIPSAGMGKGTAPKPTTTKNIILGGGAAGAATSGGLVHWFSAHPTLGIFIAATVIGLALVAFMFVHMKHQQAIDGPSPGNLIPVPAKA